MPITIRVIYGDRKDDALTVEITDLSESASQITAAARLQGMNGEQVLSILEMVDAGDYEVVL